MKYNVQYIIVASLTKTLTDQSMPRCQCAHDPPHHVSAVLHNDGVGQQLSQKGCRNITVVHPEILGSLQPPCIHRYILG